LISLWWVISHPDSHGKQICQLTGLDLNIHRDHRKVTPESRVNHLLPGRRSLIVNSKKHSAAMLESLINLQEFSNPVNIALSIVLIHRLYKLVPSFRFDELNINENADNSPKAANLTESAIEYHKRPTQFPETLVWRTYTPLELQHFDGNNGSKIVSNYQPATLFHVCADEIDETTHCFFFFLFATGDQ
jgi:hypothetical protein